MLSDNLWGLEALVIFDQSFILHTAYLFCAFWWHAEILRKIRGHTNGCSVKKKRLMLLSTFVSLLDFVLGFYKWWCSLCS